MTTYDVHKYTKTDANTVSVVGIQFRPSSVGGDIKDELFTVTRKAAFGTFRNKFAKNAAKVFESGTDFYDDDII